VRWEEKREEEKGEEEEEESEEEEKGHTGGLSRQQNKQHIYGGIYLSIYRTS
jgi:hypothetical protein